MIGVDSLIVENTPMLERVKPDLSGAKVKSFGPSYRKLPKSVSTVTLDRHELILADRKLASNALGGTRCVGRC